MYKKIQIYDYNDPKLTLDINVDDFDLFTFLTISNSFTDVKTLTSGAIKGFANGIVDGVFSKRKKTIVNKDSVKSVASGTQSVVNLYAGSQNIAIGATGAITKNYFTGSTIDFPLQFSFTLVSDEKYSAVEKMDLLLYWSLPKKELKNPIDKKSKITTKINDVMKDGYGFMESASNNLGAFMGAEKEEVEFFNWGASWLGVKIDNVLTLDKPPLVINNLTQKISFESMDRYNNPQNIKVKMVLEFLQIPTQSEYLSYFNIVSELGKIEEDLIAPTRQPINLDPENVDVYIDCEKNFENSITDGESGE